MFIATDIDWDVDMDEIYEKLDNMGYEAAADAIELPHDKYANMSTNERHDYAYDYFHHRNGAKADFFGLPDRIEIPDTFGINSTTDDMQYVTDWLSDEYGFCINNYNVISG